MRESLALGCKRSTGVPSVCSMGILPMYFGNTTGETPVGLTAKMAVLLELKDPVTPEIGHLVKCNHVRVMVHLSQVFRLVLLSDVLGVPG